MKIIKKTGALICVVTLQALSSSVLAEDTQSDKNRSWYIGGGLGITKLEPDTGSSGYDVSDSGDTGFKLFGGYDFTKQFTVEAFYADLGASKLSSDFVTLPDGEITYSTFGASALWYFWRNGEDSGSNPRKGFQAYVHGGLSFLNNSASSGINFTQDNSTQVQYGAALEYGLNNGIAVRASLDLYDKDANMIYVGVLKRFGTKSKRKVVSEPVAEPVIEVIEVEPEVIVAPVIIAEPEVKPDIDTDKDGVYDRLDQCENSSPDFSVDEIGCSIIELEFSSVNFEPQSFDLTEESKKMLAEVALTINLSPELQKLEVQAYTDSQGSKNYNLKLSEQRAQQVKDYLVSQDVREDRLVAKGYGESKPIADNATEEGRARNRRVEISVVQDSSPEAGAVPESQ